MSDSSESSRSSDRRPLGPSITGAAAASTSVSAGPWPESSSGLDATGRTGDP